MKSDPVLAVKTLPAGEGRRHPHTFKVEGGLNYLRGNTAPYFTLTYTEHRQGFPNQENSGGAGHEEVLRQFPQFADLAAMHLSDIDGVPMHAESYGWYQLAGALGGFGEKYHAGNSKGSYPLPASRLDPAKPYITHEARLPTREECLQSFARHCRIEVEEARAVMAEVDPLRKRVCDPKTVEAANPGYLANCRARWAAICEATRPRWKQEAFACIAHHGLLLYGDPWDDALPVGLHRVNDLGAPRQEPAPKEPTYINRWGITSTAAEVDHNPNMTNPAGDMTHWRVTLRCGRARMTVYYSMGSAHAGRQPTTEEVIDCIAQDAAGLDGSSFEEWARDLGMDTDSRKAHKTYMICARQGERLQKFLGADYYAELMGGE